MGSRSTRHYVVTTLMFCLALAVTACGSGAELESADAGSHQDDSGTETPPTVTSDAMTLDDFVWDAEAVSAYSMSYTQKCGGPFGAAEPTTAWFEGGVTNSRDGITMQVLIEYLVDRSQTAQVEVTQGPQGEIERATITKLGEEPSFCFELLDFTSVERNADGRMLVPLVGPAEAFDRTATEFSVGVSSCNGSPTFTVTESSEQIVVLATSWIPEGNNREACLDGVRVPLGQPIGDRMIIDGLGQRAISLLTNEDLYAPKPLEQIPCKADELDCRFAFATPINNYSVSCKGVSQESLIKGLHLHAAGVIDGKEVEVIQIKSVGTNIMLAVNITADCPNSVSSEWSVATKVGNDRDQLSRFLCTLVDLSEEQRTEERCERFG